MISKGDDNTSGGEMERIPSVLKPRKPLGANAVREVHGQRTAKAGEEATSPGGKWGVMSGIKKVRAFKEGKPGTREKPLQSSPSESRAWNKSVG